MPKLFCSTLYFTCHIFRTPCTIIPLLPYYLFYISLLASPIIRFSNNYSDDSTQCCQNKIRKTNVPNCLVQSSVTSQILNHYDTEILSNLALKKEPVDPFGYYKIGMLSALYYPFLRLQVL